MSKPDEFEATKKVVEILEPFEPGDRERILRWTRDKLGMSVPSPLVATTTPQREQTAEAPPDIRSFIQLKNPRSDTQLAAVVAYFYRFVAPETQRKETIGKDDVLGACRLAQRERPQRINQTMVDAYKAGYFDRAERGQYGLNSVGENLVAVALPGAPGGDTVPTPRASTRRRSRRATGKGAKPAKRNTRS